MPSPGSALRRRILVVLAVILLLELVLTSASGASGCPFLYLVRRGDTLSSLARRFGTTVSAIAAANGLVNPNLIFAGRFLLIPCPGAPPTPPPPGCIYVVQPGDTLTRIAARFGTTVFRLVSLNGIANPNLIFAGQCLRVC